MKKTETPKKKITNLFLVGNGFDRNRQIKHRIEFRPVNVRKYKQKDVYEVDVNHASKSPLARSFKASVTQEKGQRHGAKGHIKTLTQ